MLAASRLEATPGNAMRGVAFHSAKEWTVMDLSGYCQPHATSPIKEHEALVLFDQARCRCVVVRVPLGRWKKRSFGCGSCVDEVAHHTRWSVQSATQVQQNCCASTVSTRLPLHDGLTHLARCYCAVTSKVARPLLAVVHVLACQVKHARCESADHLYAGAQT